MIRGDDGEGFPLGPVVAFRARVPSPSGTSIASPSTPNPPPPPLNVYVLNDVLSEKGWHLNALQHPPALHMCFTAQHAPVGGSGGGAAEALLADLKAAVAAARAAPGAAVAGGSAPIYGLAGATPDRGLVRDFLETYQDVLLTG